MFNISKSETDPEKLLKKATEKKKSGDTESAIGLLKKAYKVIDNGSFEYSIDAFLRLPLYLQEAKKSDEAWGEFNKLLEYIYTRKGSIKEVVPMEESRIYDKMRLVLQREGKKDFAVKFGVFSYISWAVGLHLQKRSSELKQYLLRSNSSTEVGKLLKKAKKEHKEEKIVDIVVNQD